MQGLVHLLFHARGRDSGGGRLQPDRHARRGGRNRRRIRLRQVDGGARHHAVPGQERPHHVRRDPVQGPRHEHHEREGAAPAARFPDCHGLSGADGLAQPVDVDRAAADGSAAVPRQLLGAGGLRARPRDARQRAPAGSQADHGELSAPDLGRAAAARGHRHGPALEPGAPAPRRADHGARRHRRGRHRRADQGDQRALRHLDALHLAQSRTDPRDLRSHHGHVFGRGGGARHRRGSIRPDAPPLYQGAVQLHSATGRRQERPAAWCRSAASCRCRTSAPRAATTGRAASTSAPACATMAASPWKRCRDIRATRPAAAAFARSTGASGQRRPPKARPRSSDRSCSGSRI